MSTIRQALIIANGTCYRSNSDRIFHLSLIVGSGWRRPDCGRVLRPNNRALVVECVRDDLAILSNRSGRSRGCGYDRGEWIRRLCTGDDAHGLCEGVPEDTGEQVDCVACASGVGAAPEAVFDDDAGALAQCIVAASELAQLVAFASEQRREFGAPGGADLAACELSSHGRHLRGRG